MGGTYDVAITQQATQTVVTGSSALGGTLSNSETVTITDYDTGRIASITLSAGLVIDQVVTAVNSELADVKTEELQGSTDMGYTAATLFSAITGANNDDVITFTGIKRNGIQISGSYTISDNSTETVGDLLEGIEDMFEDKVIASLDSNGKLIINDTQVGDSQIVLGVAL